MMTNLEVIRLLKNVAAALIAQDEKKYFFQIRSYQRACEIIANLSQSLELLMTNDAKLKIPGIGPSISGHLQELFKKGRVAHFDKITEKLPKEFFWLLDFPGIGPKTSLKLVDKLRLHAKSQDELIKKILSSAKKHKICKVSTFGEALEQKIAASLNLHKKNSPDKSRIHFIKAWEMSQRIINYLKIKDRHSLVYPLGSLRRFSPTVADIDLGANTKEPKRLMQAFVTYPESEKIIDFGESVGRILVNGQQIDLKVADPSEFGSLLQHFTGSKEHNIALREYALSLGFSLSEHGIQKEGKLHKFSEEKAFYRFLGLDWIDPELRENRGEIEMAKSHLLPKLVDLKDIKGDLHIHSDYPIETSHDLGSSTMPQFLDKARSLNYEYLAFSEHNPSQSGHSGQELYDILRRRKNYLDALQKRSQIKIFSFLEVDILPDGSLPLPKTCLDLLDGCIVSLHSALDQNEKDMTNRLLVALTHPQAKILGHPTARLLLKRNGVNANWEKIFEFCQKNGKVVEINASPNRLDLPDDLIIQAKKFRLRFVINTDSHSAEQMDDMMLGIHTARRGFLTANDIANTLSYNKFRQLLNL